MECPDCGAEMQYEGFTEDGFLWECEECGYAEESGWPGYERDIDPDKEDFQQGYADGHTDAEPPFIAWEGDIPF